MICKRPNTPARSQNVDLNICHDNIPRAAMCSLVRTGWNPTKGTCMLASVPIAYHEEYATYSLLLNLPIRISASACRGIILVMNA